MNITLPKIINIYNPCIDFQKILIKNTNGIEYNYNINKNITFMYPGFDPLNPRSSYIELKIDDIYLNASANHDDLSMLLVLDNNDIVPLDISILLNVQNNIAHIDLPDTIECKYQGIKFNVYIDDNVYNKSDIEIYVLNDDNEYIKIDSSNIYKYEGEKNLIKYKIDALGHIPMVKELKLNPYGKSYVEIIEKLHESNINTVSYIPNDIYEVFDVEKSVLYNIEKGITTIIPLESIDRDGLPGGSLQVVDILTKVKNATSLNKYKLFSTGLVPIGDVEYDYKSENIDILEKTKQFYAIMKYKNIVVNPEATIEYTAKIKGIKKYILKCKTKVSSDIVTIAAVKYSRFIVPNIDAKMSLKNYTNIIDYTKLIPLNTSPNRAAVDEYILNKDIRGTVLLNTAGFDVSLFSLELKELNQQTSEKYMIECEYINDYSKIGVDLSSDKIQINILDSLKDMKYNYKLKSENVVISEGILDFTNVKTANIGTTSSSLNRYYNIIFLIKEKDSKDGYTYSIDNKYSIMIYNKNTKNWIAQPNNTFKYYGSSTDIFYSVGIKGNSITTQDKIQLSKSSYISGNTIYIPVVVGYEYGDSLRFREYYDIDVSNKILIGAKYYDMTSGILQEINSAALPFGINQLIPHGQNYEVFNILSLGSRFKSEEPKKINWDPASTMPIIRNRKFYFYVDPEDASYNLSIKYSLYSEQLETEFIDTISPTKSFITIDDKLCVSISVPDTNIFYLSIEPPEGFTTVKDDPIYVSMLDSDPPIILKKYNIREVRNSYELKISPPTIDNVTVEYKKFGEETIELSRELIVFDKDRPGEYEGIRDEQYAVFKAKNPIPIDEYIYEIKINGLVVLAGVDNINNLSHIELPTSNDRYYLLRFKVFDSNYNIIEAPQLFIYDFKNSIWLNNSADVLNGVKIFGDLLSVAYSISKRGYITHSSHVIFTKPANSHGCIINVQVILKSGESKLPSVPPKSEDSMHVIRTPNGNIYGALNGSLVKLNTVIGEPNEDTYLVLQSLGISNNLKGINITFDKYEVISWTRNGSKPDLSIEDYSLTINNLIREGKEINLLAMTKK